ncbi:inositol polyphosphate 5-phosphatase E-like [Artemia franciscana]|uniref:Inositol polyphosphate-related phosphatase domain-containing protein n=1 Tax=Artemia franciscana TaxID=6661 RepID=A0AA88L3I7_ARTSF|nr:hypothetical protein QYM36_012526 [Artemia franciscana]
MLTKSREGKANSASRIPSRMLLARHRSVGPVLPNRSSIETESELSSSKLLEFKDSPVRGRLVRKSKSVLSFTISYDSQKLERPLSCIGKDDFYLQSSSENSKLAKYIPLEKVFNRSLVHKAVQCDILLSNGKDVDKLSGSISDSTDEPNGNVIENGVSASPEKRQKRNFRSKNYLHGHYTTLGPAEVDRLLPNRRISILVGTWNMNGKTPPSDLEDLILPTYISTPPDVIVICTQESHSAKFNWEVSLQETLGPNHVMLSSSTLGTLHLSFFLRRDLIWVCSIPEDSSFSTRTGTKFRTKGAVAIGLSIFGTSFLFICSHLTAHAERASERVIDIRRISTGLELPKVLPLRNRHRDVTSNYDCVFWAGDLNFRLASQREDVIRSVTSGWKSSVSEPSEDMASQLLLNDQLKLILKNGEALKGFEEGVIAFPPTYKYVPGTNDFESTKERTPAYTDRILYKVKPGTEARCLQYDSVSKITSSDHKPVWGLFSVTVKPGDSKIPLAAGLFNRQVYIEGTKRWAEVGWSRKSRTLNSESVCNVQ